MGLFAMKTPRTWAEDLQFLSEHVATVVLGAEGTGQVVVIPEYQGRTMTSRTGHPSDFSFGWINYQRIAGVGEPDDPNLFGGEDRMWLGPEGSRYSLFFDPGTSMNLSNWRVPSAIDVPEFQLVEQTPLSVEMMHRDRLVNYAGSTFEIQLNRQVVWQDRATTQNILQVNLPESIWHVAHASHNTLRNIGDVTWSDHHGQLAIWILGMYQPSAGATVVIPCSAGPPDPGATVVTSDYFGRPDSGRLCLDPATNVVYFRGDGQFRSKIGIPRRFVRDRLGAWDAHIRCLTIVQFGLPEPGNHGYTNNLWSTAVDPQAGDVVNSYNDGPNETGGMLGPFYELETLSPALALAPDTAYTHAHRTVHLQGPREELDRVSHHVFGVTLNEIECAFR